MAQERKLGIFGDIIMALAIVGIILTVLWVYTGQFPSTPMVVVTSGSMMHPDVPYGRIGTIDPGDLVLVKRINDRDDIETRGQSTNPFSDHKSYGDYGDVIIYYPMGNEETTPIIHRAICWVEYHNDQTYSVPAYDIYHESSVNIPELRLTNCRFSHSGFITMGDNNNNIADQAGNICQEPVQTEWVIGEAKGELPWFGLIKLMIYGNPNARPSADWVKVGNAVAPKDLWICLGLSLLIIISIPVALDYYEHHRQKNNQREIE
jgi:signal peptidase